MIQAPVVWYAVAHRGRWKVFGLALPTLRLVSGAGLRAGSMYPRARMEVRSRHQVLVS